MIEPIFWKFLTNEIDPDPEIINQASESQLRMCEILKDKLRSEDDLPSVLEGEDFLFGSAMRKTQIKPFDDIDFMLVLDGSGIVMSENGRLIGGAYGVQGVQESQNSLLRPQYLNDNKRVSSQKVLARIRTVLAETYPRSSIRKSGQAVNVWLEKYGFGVDVVPALKIASELRGDHYYIPWGTDSDYWLPTNPRFDLAAFEGLNAQTNGFLLPTARLMRKWNEVSNAKRLSGFHVDLMVYRSFQGKVIKSLRDGLHVCISTFEDLLSKSIPQLTGYGHNVDHTLNPENRRKSIAAIQSARTPAFGFSKIGILAPDKHHELWNKIFSGNLPS